MKGRLYASAALLALVALFALQNAEPTEVELLLWRPALPRYLLILALLAVGIVIGWSLRAVHGLSRRRGAR